MTIKTSDVSQNDKKLMSQDENDEEDDTNLSSNQLYSGIVGDIPL